MLLAAIFIMLGIGILSKKEVTISSTRRIQGSKARNLGIIFLATGILQLITVFMIYPLISFFALVGLAASILATIYLIIFSREPDTISPTVIPPI